MANEFTNKVTLANGETLIDLTQDDVRQEHVQNGIWFHDKAGKRQQGTNTKTVDASAVTAEAADVLEGKTFGKGDQIATGTMPNKSGVNVEITTTAPVPIARGAYDGSSVAKIADSALAKLIPGNIKEGETILGITGTYGADDISSQSKTVTPTFEQQVVNPDSGYTFLTSVTVDAIPVSFSDNEAGGVTVTIG